MSPHDSNESCEDEGRYLLPLIESGREARRQIISAPYEEIEDPQNPSAGDD